MDGDIESKNESGDEGCKSGFVLLLAVAVGKWNREYVCNVRDLFIHDPREQRIIRSTFGS